MWVLLASFCLMSCVTTQTTKNELTVSSAISLKEALNDIAIYFQKSNPATKASLNFGASGELAGQLNEGAPVDLFISAGQEQMKQLVQNELIDNGSVETIAYNTLVVIATQQGKYQQLEDLRNVQRLSIGNPQTVPAGEYAVDALRKANIYEQLAKEKKLVLAENARQILTYVDGGDVDAGIVYNTDAALSKESKVCYKLEPPFFSKIAYQAGIVKNTAKQTLARDFMRLLKSPDSQELFARRGFLLQ